MLQHGSLIAREYGKPCIAGIQNLTTLLKDGDVVEMDGASGIVKKSSVGRKGTALKGMSPEARRIPEPSK